MEVLITNERAELEWAYLLERYDEARLLEVIEFLPGNRKPFPFNVAKQLGVILPGPDRLKVIQRVKTEEDLKVGRKALESLKKMLAEKR